MYSFETIDLGTYRGEDYFLVGFVEPEPSDDEDYDPDVDATGYGVAVVWEGNHPLEDNEQIVRMDTAHGRPHMDLVYLPSDTEKKRKIWLDQGYPYSKMKQYLLAEWKTFVDKDIQHSR